MYLHWCSMKWLWRGACFAILLAYLTAFPKSTRRACIQRDRCTTTYLCRSSWARRSKHCLTLQHQRRCEQADGSPPTTLRMWMAIHT